MRAHILCVVHTIALCLSLSLSFSVWFCLKLYLNDLFISIPDRLLVCAALAQVLQDVPTELLLTQWGAPHVKLYGEAADLALTAMLQMFWIVYTLGEESKISAQFPIK